MSSNPSLHPVPTVRKDGVATTVWKRIDNSAKGKSRAARGTPPVVKQTRSGKPIDFALEFDINNPPEVNEPKWWSEFVKSSETEGEFPSTPELLDIIPSPVGDLAVVYQPLSQEKNDTSGWDSGYDINILYYKSVETGEKMGYLKMEAMTDEGFVRSYADDEFTPFRYRHRYSGTSYEGIFYAGYNRYAEEDGEPTEPPATAEELRETRKKVWATAHRDFNMGYTKDDGTYIASYNITVADAPDDDKALVKSLKRFADITNKDIEHSRANFSADAPFVGYSRVMEPIKGSGFGVAMYIYGAKVLGRRGAVLRASSSQTDDAQALWSKMKEKMPEHVIELTRVWHGKKSKPNALDFRS